MTLLQITNGAIDPNWVTACLMAGLIFFLVRTLNRLEKKQDIHDEKIQDHEVRIKVIERKEE